MNRLVSFRIRADYVMARAVPTAPEIACGVEQGWLSPSDAVAIAVEKLDRGCLLTPPEERLALLLVDDLDEVPALVSELGVGFEPMELRERLWLFLALDWLADHREDFDDPYEVIEMLYADFGYPAEISGLVRWMPVAEGEPTGIGAIDEKWGRYLASTRQLYVARDDEAC
jgi:hypothetical protein